MHVVAKEFFERGDKARNLIRPSIEMVGAKKTLQLWSLENLGPLVSLLNDEVALGDAIDKLRLDLVSKEKEQIEGSVTAGQQAASVVAELTALKNSQGRLAIEQMIALSNAEVAVGVTEALRPLRQRRLANLGQIVAEITSPK